MQITALIQVINYLKEITENPVLVEGYKKLSEKVKEASGDTGGDFWAEILYEKDLLKDCLLKTDPSDWGYASYSLFENIDKNQLFGKAAAASLDDLIRPDNKDYKSIYSNLSWKLKHISKLSETLYRFQHLFDQIVPAEVFQTNEESENKSSLFLYFEGRLSVKNIADLERYARLWDGILNSFSRITGEENLTLDINSFRNGNIVLDVTTQDKTLNSIITGIVEILNLLPVILKIRKIQTEIVLIPLYNNINDQLEDEISRLINQKAFESAQKLVSDKLSDSMDSEEIINDLSRALKQILSFVEKGGKIEFKPLMSTPEIIKTNKALIEAFAIAREMEKVTDVYNQVFAKSDIKINDDESGAPEPNIY
jgi:hypothetical protein